MMKKSMEKQRQIQKKRNDLENERAAWWTYLEKAQDEGFGGIFLVFLGAGGLKL